MQRFLRKRVRNAADIPDILQEVFLRLLRVSRHERIRTPEAYIFTITRHVAQQHQFEQIEVVERPNAAYVLGLTELI